MNYEKVRDDRARWVLEFVDAQGSLERALKFATKLRQTIYPLLMDGKAPLTIGETNDPKYICAARALWMDFFEGNRYRVPKKVVNWISRDMGAPWLVFGQLRAKAFMAGYKSGSNEDFDRLCDDLMPGGILH